LFAEFVFIYTSEGGRKQDCMSCNFKTVFNRWQNSNITVTKKNITMADNTFKLKNENELIAIPLGLGTISKDSPDELVEKFLNQEKGKYREARINRFFAKVPDKKVKKKTVKKAAPTAKKTAVKKEK
jgi:hypothetical protein